jgi:MFS family permease
MDGGQPSPIVHDRVKRPDRGASVRTGWDWAVSGIECARTVLDSRDLRRLLGARMASQLAEGAFMAGVLQTVVFLPEQQSTLRDLAFATALTLLPFSLLQPVAGVFVDRWRRRRILVVVALLRAGVSPLMLAGADAVALVYITAFVVFSANRVFQTTTAAVIPRVLGSLGAEELADRRVTSEGAPKRGSQLFVANTLSSIAGTVALFGGVALGGRVAVSAGIPALLVLVCAAWIGAALLSSFLSGSLAPRRPAGSPLRGELAAALADLGDGFRRIGVTPGALIPILTVAVGQFLQVLIIAVSLVVLKEGLDGGMATFSWLVAAGGAGVLLGFLTVGWLGRRLATSLLNGAAFLLSAGGVVPPIVSLGEGALVVGAMLLGPSYAWSRVPAHTLAQRAVPDRYRGRVFSAVDLGFNTARVLGAVAAVPLVPLLGVRATLVAAAILSLLWAVVASLWLRSAGLE